MSQPEKCDMAKNSSENYCLISLSSSISIKVPEQISPGRALSTQIREFSSQPFSTADGFRREAAIAHRARQHNGGMLIMKNKHRFALTFSGRKSAFISCAYEYDYVVPAMKQ
ncbi:hypothetical protein AVEN_37643-1 [Araneus ventricosus]|uniref:Uncharacterized protein n=1 Tax=Araneus ventricosus TaxID=182803 RepID=A0A4Y2V1G1_ARAVE|nr:hypothetical protein AVEN_37643-1 [Araneus ventricosus]